MTTTTGHPVLDFRTGSPICIGDADHAEAMDLLNSNAVSSVDVRGYAEAKCWVRDLDGREVAAWNDDAPVEPAATRPTRSIGAKELAVLIRRDLKAAFPACKFSVTSDHYSMGSSVSVRWTDGPTVDPVDAIANAYQGISFDGMTDSTNYHPILVDGERCSASSYVRTSRSQSHAEWQAAIAEAIIRQRCAVDADGRFGNDWVANLANRMVRALGTDQPSIEVAFRRGVMREHDAAEACGAFAEPDAPEDLDSDCIHGHHDCASRAGGACSDQMRTYDRCAGCNQERIHHVEPPTRPEPPAGRPTKEDFVKKTSKAAAEPVGGRCPTCGAIRDKKAMACLRCAANATAAKRFIDPPPAADHECDEPDCAVRISNRYKITRCAAHSLAGARAEQAKLVEQRKATHAARVEQGKRLAEETKRRAKDGAFTHYLDGSPVRGHARIMVVKEQEKGTTPEAIRALLERSKEEARMKKADEANASTDETRPTTGADGAKEDTMNTKKTAAKATATSKMTARPAATERAKPAKAAAPKATTKRAATTERAAKVEPPKVAKSWAGNVKVSDDVVIAHIVDHVKHNPEASIGATLKALHAAGKACNPVRFRALFLATNK